MENKFRKATRRITAVAAGAAMVTSSMFGASLSDYPKNFVEGDKFNGQVVIGNQADSAAAISVIADLKKDLAGGTKVKITAKKTIGGGSEFKILDSGKVMKYGSNLRAVKPTAVDDKDMKILADKTFDNGIDDQDYEQFVRFYNNGFFERALRDDFETETSTHLFLEDMGVFNYTVDMKSNVKFSTSKTNWQNDFVGETINLLGSDYTIISVTEGDTAEAGTSHGLTKLELVGGSNKLSLGEGESTSITVEGVSYEISVQSVSTDNKVLLTVNGESKSIKELDVGSIGGITIAVTDLVSSSRDSVKGYASLVIGGNKIKLMDNEEVEVNDKDISELFDNYKVMAYFDGDGSASTSSQFAGFTLSYSIEDEILLQEGKSFEDKVFNVLGIKYGGTNNVDYKTVKISTSGNKLRLEGETSKGDKFSDEVARLYDEKQATTTPTFLMGNGDDDALIVGDLDRTASGSITDGAVISLANGLYLDDVVSATEVKINGRTFTGLSVGSKIVIGNYQLNVDAINATHATFTPDGVKFNEANGFRFITGDLDDQQFYELSTYSTSRDEVDVKNILNNDKDDDVKITALASKLSDVTGATTSGTGVSALLTTLTGVQSEIIFANEYVVDLSQVPNAATTSSAGGMITVYTDISDLNADVEVGDQGKLSTGKGASKDLGDFPAITLNLRFDTTDDEFNVDLDTTKTSYVLLPGAESDTIKENNKVREYVDKFGTKIRIDDDDKKWVEIMTPNKQVEASVYLTAGAAPDEVSTFTVEESAADAKVKELEGQGFKVTTEKVTTAPVKVDITAPVMAADVTGMADMIVVGGPAVNNVAAKLLGLPFPSHNEASGLTPGEAVVRYFSDSNSVLVYGWDAAGTTAAANKLNSGGLTGSSVDVN